MPKLSLEFFIEGEKQLVRKIRKVATACRDFEPEFKETGKFLTTFFSGPVFDTDGRVIDEHWKKRQNEKKYTWPLLERSGRMRRSFGHKASLMSVNVFNAADYFKYHQSKRHRRTKLPRRVMMKLDENRRQKIVRIFHEGLINRLRIRG